MRSFIPAALLAFAASSSAYQILVPSEARGWTNVGPQPFTWVREAQDQLNFTVVLTNPDRELMPFDQVLLALTNGDLGNTTLNPPSAGWPIPGEGYRLLIVDSVTNQTGILAESQEFEIEEPSVSSSTRSTSTSTSARNTATEHPDAEPTDDTLPVDDTVDDDDGVASLKVPAALAAVAALFSAVLL